MDAALDAMTPYGFPNKLVRRTVDQLLKVYGGNDGWVFIEDAAYTLLINTLLEQQQQEDQDCLLEDNPENAAGCSNRTLLLPCSNTETSDDAPFANQAVDTISATSETGNQLPMAVYTSAATSQPSNQLLIAGDTATATNEVDNQVPIKAIIGTVSADNEYEPPETKSSQPIGQLCHKRRRPCHGWISSDDDDEEEDLIELSALHKLVNGVK